MQNCQTTAPTTSTAPSLWEATAVAAEPSPPLTADVACDVAVVGAGFTGLRAALALAEGGADVAVFDAHDVGWGASGRSGGQVNPMLPVKHPDDLWTAVGPDHFERLTEVSLNSADETFALIHRYAIPCDARQRGWLRVDHSPKARRLARNAAAAWNALGAGFAFVDGEDVHTLTGSPAYASATLSTRGGAIHPLSLVRGLARVARQRGARLYSRAPIAAYRRLENRWHLSASGHTIRAETVVLATNGYTGSPWVRLKGSVLPLYPVQIATDPLGPDQLDGVLPKGHTVSDTRRLIMYARREPGGQVVFGGIGYRRPWASPGGFAWLLKDARRVFPSLASATWRYRWGGQIALTQDRIPHFHEPAPGLLAGLGYNGRGVAMALVMGRILAERALGAAPSTLPFPASPIKTMAFRDLQLAGAGVAMHWLRLRDSLEWR